MRNLFVLFLSAILFVSCSIDTADSLYVFPELTEMAAETNFAIALSKAVSDNLELRQFLQRKALAQFDRDYDVFYPFVKDEEVVPGKTFREFILFYLDEHSLSSIEMKLPLLTIYIPDYSWAGAFDVNMWDASMPEMSIAVKSNSNLELYSHGKYEGRLGPYDYADFPVAIIKNNERMKVTGPNTKGTCLAYDFLDPVFDGTANNIETRDVESVFYYTNIDNIQAPNNIIPLSEVPGPVLNAYNEFSDCDYQYHRDYIYFGMSRIDTTGVLNTYIREYLYKFRFKNPTSGCLYDATTLNDPNYADGSFPSSYAAEGDSLSITQLRQKDFRMDGNLEMRFYVSCCNRNGQSLTTTISLPVRFKDLFSYDKVYVDYKHHTWFSHSKYVYTINPECLVPKWYVANIQLPIASGAVWDLSDVSTSIKISVEEYDSGETVQRTHSTNYSLSSNITTENTSEYGIIKTKTGFGITSGLSRTTSTTISSTNSSDILGDVMVNYVDPIILNQVNDAYNIYAYDTGAVVMMIMPRHI